MFQSGALTLSQTTTDEGRFVFDGLPVPTGTILVRARGFAPLAQTWSAREGTPPLQLVLFPASRAERVTVTAARREMRVSDAPASVIVLSSEDLSTAGASSLDDMLRQVPGFSLFRRSGSRTANPTTQGVSLRGFGASGASRALVLVDGIPVNDPFGGWVYWDRVPRVAVEAIEVVRGATSHLYGTSAIGGVVNIRTRKLDRSALWLETSYGTTKTPDVSGLAQVRAGRWGLDLATEASRTEGYILVDQVQRGTVDTRAGSQHQTLDLALERRASDRSRVFARGLLLAESRRNGTPLQTNRTHLDQFTLGLDWQSDFFGALTLRAYGGSQVFHQSFSAVAADRNSETLTNTQRVPARQVGGTVQISRPARARHTLVAGLDAQDTRGTSEELFFAAGGARPRSSADAGGHQRVFGVFGEDLIRLTPRWVVTAAARVDSWRNDDGFSTSTPLAPPGPVTMARLADRSETPFSPRLSVLHRLTDRLALTASVYRGFRAPTLNELYRSFRVGDVLTLANDKLRAERLTGGEMGASFTTPNQRLAARGDFFWSEITRPVANVTLSALPGLITRQRQNLGRVRSRGVGFDAEVRVTPTLVLAGGYQFADAIVSSFPANAALEGLRVPQVPRQQFTLQLRYSSPRRITLGVQGRVVGPQFDDDQNRFRLESFATADAFISRSFGHNVEVFAAAENLFNRRYSIGRTPVRTIGPPLFARPGVKLTFRERSHASSPAPQLPWTPSPGV